MPVYVCPGCDAELRSAAAAPPGRKVKCKQCGTVFVPVDEPLKLADDPPPPPPPKKPAADDDDNPYLVAEESEEEKKLVEKNKPKFGDVQQKFKKSARGPAMALLVTPSNLLIAEGVITFLLGIAMFLYGMFPLVFTDAPPSDDDYAEQVPIMLLGVIVGVWGSLICLGASRMQALESYTWAMTGAALGVLPFLVGIYALVMLRNPKVVAGFEEIEGSIEGDEGGGDEEDEDDEDDDDDE